MFNLEFIGGATILNEPWHEISNKVVLMCDQQRLSQACAYAQTDQSLCWSLKYSMTVKLLTQPHLRFISFKAGCTGSSESTLVKMPHCWKPHVTAQMKVLIVLASEISAVAQL